MLILARDQNIFDDKLDQFGADRLKKVKIENPAEESSPELEKLARSVNGGVVIAPQDLELGDLIKNLETQLPWLQ